MAKPKPKWKVLVRRAEWVLDDPFGGAVYADEKKLEIRAVCGMSDDALRVIESRVIGLIESMTAPANSCEDLDALPALPTEYEMTVFTVEPEDD